jgi:hypothetical protein
VHATGRNWTQAAKQTQQDANAGASSKTDASARNWTQAAKQTQQDANAGASSKTDAKETDASEDASADTSSKTEARQAGALWLEGTHLIVVKGKMPAKRTDKGGGWLQCWFF